MDPHILDRSKVVTPEKSGSKAERVVEWNKVADASYESVKKQRPALVKEGFSHVVVVHNDQYGRRLVSRNGRDVTKTPDNFKNPCDLCGLFPCKAQRYMDEFCIFIK